MTPDKRSGGPAGPPPIADPAAATEAEVASTVHGGTDVAAGLRRRRELAARLPVLEDGRRDPLDALAGLPVRPPEPCHGAELGAGGGWRPCCMGDVA
jgi:hypothetical protein